MTRAASALDLGQKAPGDRERLSRLRRTIRHASVGSRQPSLRPIRISSPNALRASGQRPQVLRGLPVVHGGSPDHMSSVRSWSKHRQPPAAAINPPGRCGRKETHGQRTARRLGYPCSGSLTCKESPAPSVHVVSRRSFIIAAPDAEASWRRKRCLRSTLRTGPAPPLPSFRRAHPRSCSGRGCARRRPAGSRKTRRSRPPFPA